LFICRCEFPCSRIRIRRFDFRLDRQLVCLSAFSILGAAAVLDGFWLENDEQIFSQKQEYW
jgi:hypothetical protein